MKIYMLVSLICFLLLHACAGKEINLKFSIAVLKEIESNNNPKAIGDGGNAVGVLQIWPIMVQEVNRISGKNFTLNDRFCVDKSEEMASIYLNHYLNLELRNGNEITHKTVAYLWNGGPDGRIYAINLSYGNERKRKNLENYWKKYLTYAKAMLD